MIGYVTLGTNDIDRAARFYDTLLAEIGARRVMEGDRFVAWSVAPDKPALGVIKPYDGNAATVGNGTTVALVVDSRAKVDALYRKALDSVEPTRARPGRAVPGSTQATSAISTATS